MSYYVKDQRVLACVDFHGRGSKHNEWAPGVVTGMGGGGRPYEVTLEEEHDGRRVWYFGAQLVCNDNRRNRRNKGLPYARPQVERTDAPAEDSDG